MSSLDYYLNSTANDAYTYYDQHIAALPKNPDGSWDFSSGAFHNTDVDAFRHAFAAMEMAYKVDQVLPGYGADIVQAMGDWHEIAETNPNYVQGTPQPANEENMDLWNNAEGLSLYAGIQSSLNGSNYLSTIGSAAASAIQNGDLIVDPNAAGNPTFDHDDLTNLTNEIINLTYDLDNFSPSDFSDLVGDLFDSLADAFSNPTGDSLVSSFESYSNIGETYFHTTQSPIALDLNGDGIHYTSLANSHVYFDIDNDHFAEHVEWLDTHDGFLVRDLNSNGQIDNVTEMFGDNDGTTAYAKLAALDTNSDGKLSSSDTAWSSLNVWVDANSNGVVDSGELKTLASLNIASISLAAVNDTALAGHAVAGDSLFTYTNGSTGQLADVLLQTDQMDSWFIGDGTSTSTEVDPETLVLPLSRGYGTLPSLHYAMTQDTTLKGLVSDFAQLDPSTDMHTVYDQVEDIVLRWAGAESTDPAGAGAYVDGRHLAVLEAISDLAYQYLYTGSSDVPSYYGDDIGKAYSSFVDEILVRLLVQGPLQSIFPNAQYDFVADKLELNDSLSSILTLAQAQAPVGADDKSAFWNEIARIVVEYHSDLGVSDIAAKAAVDTAAGFLTHIVSVTGTTGDDFLFASGPGATYAEGTSDTLAGGAGDDFIGTGMGDDLIVFRDESSTDTVENDLGYDAILLQNATSSQVALSTSGDDIVISIASLSETITVQNQFETASFGRTHDHDIHEIQFSDGVIWNQSTLESVANGGAAPTPLTGTSGNDTLTAGASDINMTGLAGADVFKITQASSNFVTLTDFNFAQGDRIDIGAFDGIHSLADLQITDRVGHASFVLHASTGDITVNLSGLSSGQITQDFFLGNDLNYGSGTTITGTSSADNLNGSSGGDTIYANEGGDTVQGNFGGDVIYGWTGDDTISAGYGHDTVSADDGNDLVNGNSGNDLLYGGLGTDAIYGGDGNDTVGGDAGNDTIYGGDGNDSVYGSDDSDSVFGDAGNDYLAGELGTDHLYGGDDADVLSGGAGADTLDGGAGSDTADYQSSASGVNVDLTLATAQSGGDAAGDVLSNFENVNGSSSNDTITGDTNANYLRGFGGADNIHGGNGNDTIDGGAGADTLDGGSGTDTIDYQASSAAVNVDLSVGTAQSGGDAQGDVLSAIENLNGSVLNDTLSGDSGANYVRGFAGADNIHGSGGNDTIDGGAGADMLDGGTGTNLVDYQYSSAAVSVSLALATAQSGGDAQGDILSNFANLNGSIFNDTLAGDTAANSILGLSGDDTVSGGAGADTLDGGAGYDTADYQSSASGVQIDLTLATAQSGGDAQGDILSNFENVSGSASADALTGDAGNNVLKGMAGNDSVSGGDGDDTIDGGAGADTLNGGLGSNLLTYEASSAAISLNLATGTNTGGDAQGDVISNFHIINGSTFGDQFIGDTGDNYFNGMGGNDTVDGGQGADTLDGGTGTDTIDYHASSAAVNVLLGLATEQSGGDAQGDILSNFEDIIGSAYADTLSGDSAANHLAGLAGADDIHGNDGNDTLDGGAGADTLNGGDGVNLADYSNSSAAVTVDISSNAAQSGGDAAGDILYHIQNLNGSAYADGLTGDAGANTLSGLDGNDTVHGQGGSDIGYGGVGSDLVQGNDGTDSIYGGDGSDTVYGDNTVEGGSDEADVVDGGGGSDTVYGGGGSDYLYGDLTGTYGNDAIYGGSGIDILYGGSGDDTLDGGNDNDWLVADAGADSLVGGSGTDLVTYLDSTSGVNVNLSLATAQSGGYAAGDIIAGIENLYGSSYNDTLTGDTGNNYFYDYGGNDSISGGNGDDSIEGAAGADTLDGGAGTDYVYYQYSGAAVNVSLALATAQSGGDAQGDILSNFEGLIGSSYNDTLAGSSAANTLYGLDGDDLFIGGAGADVLIGGNGLDTTSYVGSSAAVTVNLATNVNSGGDAASDYLSGIENVTGSSFADSLTGDGGANVLNGGAGADTINGGAGTDTVSYAGSSAGVNVSLALATAQSGGDAAGDILSNLENVIGSSQNDTIAGTSGANTLDGGAGVDTVSYANSSAAVTVNLTLATAQSGGDAAGDILSNFENIIGSGYGDTLTANNAGDSLSGGAGVDVLYGGTGVDTLDGGNDNDWLVGSSGADSMIGGAGTDIVTYIGSSSAVNVNLTLATAQSGGDAAGDILSGVENAYGSNYNDTLTGDTGNNYFYGYDGADSISGGNGNDSMEGAAGADTIDGGAGTDYVYYSNSSAAVNVSLALATAQAGGDAQGDILSNFEGLVGSGYSDTLTGDSGGNAFYGLGGDDTISGAAGNDTMIGGTGNDTFVFQSGTGADYVADFEGAGAAGGDVIQIASGIYANYTALSSHITYNASNAVIDLGGGNNITVVGASSSQHFVAGDFTFV